jgi:hypothetical protein
MNRTLEARLARLEAARRNPMDAMTDAQVEARIQEVAQELGGFEAILASLDDSCAEERRLRELIPEYVKNGFRGAK